LKKSEQTKGKQRKEEFIKSSNQPSRSQGELFGLIL